MHARRLILIPGLVLLGRLATPTVAVTNPKGIYRVTPVTSLATVTGSPFFTGFKFMLNAAGAFDSMQTYRPPRTSILHRRMTLRLRVTKDGAVDAISFGFQPYLLSGGRSFRTALSDFVNDIAPRADSAQLSAFVTQLRRDTAGVSDSGLFIRGSADTLLPKLPSPTYLTLLGHLAVGAESFSASELRVTRFIDGPDTTVVMTLASRDANVTVGRGSDWVDTRRFDLLGTAMDEVETTDVVVAMKLKLSHRSHREAVYDRGVYRSVLRLALDSAQHVTRATLAVPDRTGLKLAPSVPVDSMASTLLLTVFDLAPRADSAAVVIITRALLLKQRGPNAVPGERVLALLRRTRTIAAFDLEHSTVHMTREGSGRNARILIAVGAPGSFNSETKLASKAAPAVSHRRAGITAQSDSDPGALYRTPETPLTQQRVKKP